MTLDQLDLVVGYRGTPPVLDGVPGVEDPLPPTAVAAVLSMARFVRRDLDGA